MKIKLNILFLCLVVILIAASTLIVLLLGNSSKKVELFKGGEIEITMHYKYNSDVLRLAYTMFRETSSAKNWRLDFLEFKDCNNSFRAYSDKLYLSNGKPEITVENFGWSITEPCDAEAYTLNILKNSNEYEVILISIADDPKLLKLEKIKSATKHE